MDDRRTIAILTVLSCNLLLNQAIGIANWKIKQTHKKNSQKLNIKPLIQWSIKTASAQLAKHKRRDQRFYNTGSSQKIDFSSHWHHGKFMHEKDAALVQQKGRVGLLVLRATAELQRRTHMSIAKLRNYPGFLDEWRRQIGPLCRTQVLSCRGERHNYRTPDASCNNIAHPSWGASMRQQARFLMPAYMDGFNMPRMLSVTGAELPSPRRISNVVHNAASCKSKDQRHTVMLMTWGQFIDHDMISTPMIKGSNNSDIMCCDNTEVTEPYSDVCLPVAIPKDDEHFGKNGSLCMNFVRSVAVPSDSCDPGYRNQLNQATSIIDASMVYDSGLAKQHKLRTGYRGLLQIGPLKLLPKAPNQSCVREDPGDYCFEAGDDRSMVVPSLGVLHTIFVREHNRIAEEIHSFNPHWKDERIFQESRKIISAYMQHITYSEYLTVVLGRRVMNKYGLLSKPFGFSNIYNPNVDPTIANGFGVAAFRFGHSQIPNLQSYVDPNFETKIDVNIEDTFNRAKYILLDHGCGLDGIARWLMSDKQMQSDRFIENGVRNLLFLDKSGNSFDLAALNIQRGRDHGVPSYNAWRKWCGLPVAFHFRHVPGGLIDIRPDVASLLASTYSHPDDIDLFTGGLTEIPIPGGTVGPTFACIIGKQFHNLKFGDRFWYENNFPNSGFTAAQLNSIKRVKLSKIMCTNLDISSVQCRAMDIPSKSNRRGRCSALPGLDIRLWQEVPQQTILVGVTSNVVVPYSPQFVKWF